MYDWIRSYGMKYKLHFKKERKVTSAFRPACVTCTGVTFPSPSGPGSADWTLGGLRDLGRRCSRWPPLGPGDPGPLWMGPRSRFKRSPPNSAEPSAPREQCALQAGKGFQSRQVVNSPSGWFPTNSFLARGPPTSVLAHLKHPSLSRDLSGGEGKGEEVRRHQPWYTPPLPASQEDAFL